jgi:hypothetical protein
MKKMFLFLLLLSSFLNASYLYDKDTPVCIEDFYVKKARVYFLKSSSGSWSSTTENNTIKNIYSGYKYDSDSKSCIPEKWLLLGMDVKDWHFLEALTGLLFGFSFMIFTIFLFINVGKEK